MSIKDYIEEELLKLPFDCKVYIYDEPRDKSDYDKLITSRFGLTKQDEPIVEFYAEVIDKVYREQKDDIKSRYSSLQKYIQCIVRHEYRHYEQYKFALQYDKVKLVLSQDRAIERDAIDFENGIVNDLHKIFKV